MTLSAEYEGHLSDFVVSDEEMETSGNNLHHHHHHRSSSFDPLNLSQTSMTTANTDAAATQTFLRQLQLQEDTSTSFNTNADGSGEGVGGDEKPTEVPTKNNTSGTETLAIPVSTPEPQKRKQSNSTPSSAIPASASLFRYLRSLTSRTSGETAEGAATSATPAAAAAAEPSESGDSDVLDSASSSSSSSSSSWTDDEEDVLTTDMPHQQHLGTIDWSHLPAIPNRFCDTGRSPQYLDTALLDPTHLTRQLANAFVAEHASILEAVLQLLAERDQVGVEGSTEFQDNIWKKGSLKKLSFAVGRRNQGPAVAGAWKVKYVEIRQGNLCYYEDDGGAGHPKTIHLRQADTTIQESNYCSTNRGPGFVFELIVQGSPTKYWMASSEAERQGWMRAIQAATIGDEGDGWRRELDLQPYEESLQLYTSLRDALQQADTQKLYLSAIQLAIKELASLQVPVQWVRELSEKELSPVLLGTFKPPRFRSSPQKRLRSSIAEFWNMMRQTTFTINGLTVPRKSQMASERVVGALTRCILEFDKASMQKEEHDDVNIKISELQAVSYARHILLSVLRGIDRQDISCAVKYLLVNPFVTVESHRTMDEPVHMEVSFAGEDLPDDFPEPEDLAAWVWTRTRKMNLTGWKQRHMYAVLSGTVLSFYEAAEPRPHGLRGQLVLNSNMSVKEEGDEPVTDGDSHHSKNSRVRYCICISSERTNDRLLYFDKLDDAILWKEAVEEAIQNAHALHNPPRVVTTATTLPDRSTLLKEAERAIKVAADGTIQSGIRVILGAKDGGIRVIKGAKDGGIRVIKGATGGGIRVIKTATGAGFKVVRGAVGAVGRLRTSRSADEGEPDNESSSQRPSDGSQRPSLDILLNNTIVHGKREPTVQCVIRTMETFSIKSQGFSEDSTEDDSGRTKGEAWMSVEAKLYQAFLMSGGQSGRIARGDALVELHFVETSIEDDDASC